MFNQHLHKNKTGALGGLKQYILVAPESYFEKIEGLVADSAVIAAPHQLKAGKSFIKIYAALDSGKIASEPIGSFGHRSQKFVLNCDHPGITIQSQEFIAWAQNQDFIVLVPMANGEIQQLGKEDQYAQVSAAYDSGTNSSPSNKNTFTVESVQDSVYFYPFPVPEAPEAVAPVRLSFDYVFRNEDQVQLYFDDAFENGIHLYSTEDGFDSPINGGGYYGEINGTIYTFIIAFDRALGVEPVAGTLLDNFNHTSVNFNL